MAIKSKGKTKARPASKGPRRGPVPVPKPFVQRRWVQLTALFIAGLLAMTVFVWATNGLRRERASNQAATDLASRQQALSKWKAILEPQITAVGELKGDIPPTVASDVTAAVTALASGKATTAKRGSAHRLGEWSRDRSERHRHVRPRGNDHRAGLRRRRGGRPDLVEGRDRRGAALVPAGSASSRPSP